MKCHREGTGLDYVNEMTMKYGKGVVTMTLGPLFHMVVCSSPESAKISLGQGMVWV